MGKIYFIHGVMGAMKTTDLISVAKKYESKGIEVMVLKPTNGIRPSEGLNHISSRLGIEYPCTLITNDWIPFSILPNIILVDECQFLAVEQTRKLIAHAREHNKTIMFYGLKNSYVDELIFPSSALLLYEADSIREIKTVCHFCDNKATHNLAIVDNVAVYSGEMFKVGDVKESNDFYLGVCSKCYRDNIYCNKQ